MEDTTLLHEKLVAMNEALLLGSLRQHKLAESAEHLNAQLRMEMDRRQRVEEVLQVSETRLRALFDLGPVAIYACERSGIITDFNRRSVELWGRTPALGDTDERFCGSYKMYRPDGIRVPHDQNPMAEVLAGTRSSVRDAEVLLERPDGTWINIVVNITQLKNDLGEITGAINCFYDITERKQAEEAMRVAGERFRFMAESMPQKIFTAKPNGEADYFNQQWPDFTGLTFEQLSGFGWVQFIHADDVEETVRRWKHSVETGEYFELKHRVRRHDGEYRWHVTRAHALRNADGMTTMWIGSNTDIDDVMQVQERLVDAQALLADRAGQLERLVDKRTAELTAAHVELLTEADERKRLEAEVAGAIEGERERLGQELHDGLAQDLTGIAMLLLVLAQKLMKPLPELASEAQRLCVMLEEAHGNARNLAKSFYPVELEHHGLLAALQGIAQRTQQQFGVSCAVQADAHEVDELDEASAIQLYRITQEAVHNAVKHAQAKEILIHLRKQEDAWMLTVKDDGIGLRNDGRKAGGMGLRIMQYRARIIEGTLSVVNDPDGGVLVSCRALGVQTKAGNISKERA